MPRKLGRGIETRIGKKVFRRVGRTQDENLRSFTPFYTN